MTRYTHGSFPSFIDTKDRWVVEDGEEDRHCGVKETLLSRRGSTI